MEKPLESSLIAADNRSREKGGRCTAGLGDVNCFWLWFCIYSDRESKRIAVC